MMPRLFRNPRALSLAEPRPMSRDKADMLMLLTACVLVLLPHASHLPLWASALSVGLLLWRSWITFRGNRMPPRWLLAPLVAAAMAAVYTTHKTFVGRDAGVTMLALLLAFKLLEMHARRDLFVVVFLSFFLMLMTFFYAQTIGTALLIAAAVVAMLTAQLSFQYTGAAPPLRKRLWAGMRIFLLALPLTIVFFLFFPRIQGPLWHMPGESPGARTGISDTMAPGNIARLALSDDIAFRVKFLDRPPPNAQRYWRATVMGAFDGRTWSSLGRVPPHQKPMTIERHGPPLRYEVTMEPSSQRWLYALEAPHRVPEIVGNQVSLTHTMQLVAAAPITERLRYQAESSVAFTLQRDESPVALRDWLDLPVGYNPATHQFAARLRSRTDDSVLLVNTVLAMFRDQGFRYTLEPPALGRHSVDEFLFVSRAGFCEHFASAFVFLMRALDIPARVVTGYQGGEMNPVDGFMTVRQSDAHAWAEVWVARRGWVRVDPTAAVAPSRIERNLGSTLQRGMLGGLLSFDGGTGAFGSTLHRLRSMHDAATNAWNQWVLNYTPEKQKSFLQRLGFNDPDWRTMAVLLMIGASLAMGTIALALLRTRRPADPIEVLYRNLCARLARRGFAREAHEGPSSYRRRLIGDGSPLTPQGRAAASRFLQLVETARYGMSDPRTNAPTPHCPSRHDGKLIAQLRSLLSQCR